MTRGKPRDPSAAKRGTENRKQQTRTRKAAADIVKVPGAAVAVSDPFPPPADLPVAAHSIWRAAVADLGGANHMRESFAPTLSAYCNAVLVHNQASAHLHEYGLLVEGQHGFAPNPMLKIQKDAAATMLRMAETLGLTPAARVRVGLMEVTGMSLLAGLNSVLDGK